MSFILDALRKSERERQQQVTPGIADAAHRPVKKTPNRWLIVVVAILAANALLVTALLLRDRGAPPPGARTVQPANLPKSAPAPARRPALTAPKREDIRPLEEEVPVEDDPSAVVAMATREPAPAAVTQAPAAPARAVPAPAGSASAGIPTMEELVLDGQLEMQPLRLDIHVYSQQSDQRFVFINMTKYREGEPTKEGPRVEAITADGVILSHRGNRFLLTR